MRFSSVLSMALAARFAYAAPAPAPELDARQFGGLDLGGYINGIVGSALASGLGGLPTATLGGAASLTITGGGVVTPTLTVDPGMITDVPIQTPTIISTPLALPTGVVSVDDLTDSILDYINGVLGGLGGGVL